MTAIVVDDAREAPAEALAGCFHCGLPVARNAPWRASVRGATRAFCCAGCLAISQTIDAAGLEAFYARRGGPSAAPPPGADDWHGSDDDALRSRLARRVDGDRLEAALLVEGMTCGACVWLIESWLARQPGVDQASVNFATRRARVRWREGRASLAAMLAALRAIGYRAHPYDPARREALARRERRGLLARMSIALLGMMQVMMFSVPTYLATDDVAPDHQALLDWASLVLTLPVLAYSAAPLFRGAWRDLAMRRLGMNVPVVAGLVAAFAASAWSTLGHGGPVYYDSVTMFVALLLVARFAELVARQRAGDAIERVARHRPLTAEHLVRWPDATAVESVDAAALSAGMHVLVRPGAGIPADGAVVDGRSHVEEAVLTGESRARFAGPGDRVLEGGINRDGALVVRVTAAGDATRLAAVLRLVEQAASERPRVARLADRVAQVFVGALLALALAVALYWLHADAARALPVTFALLVVSCPCALSLATPATFAAAAGALSRRDVVVAKADALETLARVTHVVLDKTGTLTRGRLHLVAMHAAEGDRAHALAVAAALEAYSEHPLALALRAAAGAQERVATDVRNVAGEGIEGSVGGVRYRVGRARFVGELGGAMPDAARAFVASLAPSASVVVLGSAAGVAAVFALDDELRDGAREAVAALHALGIRTLLRSGDREEASATVAGLLGVKSARGDCSPEDKRDAIRELQAKGAVVAMVGDGVNDAPGLAQAQVSISLASGAPLAQWTADVVVLSDDPARVAVAIAHARRTLAIVRQNLYWAFAYNAIAIPAAALGLVTPLVAAAGMSLSSLVVVCSAMRAGRFAGGDA